MKRQTLIILLLLVAGRVPAQSLEAAFPVIDSLYKDYAEKNHIPGLAFAIVANGKLVHTGTFGYTDVQKKTPVTARSVFRIASMTKSFTAMAILSLRDAGKLNLDDPVYKYIPEIKKIHTLTDDSPPITIRHLLTHSAGFPEDNPWGDRQLQRTDEELISFIKGGVSLSNTPGLAFEYSNLGFALLGHIVTKVAGEPYEQYIRRTIFQPLGMDHTYWEYTEAPPETLAHGYRWLNLQWKEEPLLHSGAYGAMGGMLTSLEDFSHYMIFHLSAWPPRNETDAGPVKRGTIREMHQPGKISGFYTQARNASGDPCPRLTAYNCGLVWNKDCTGKEGIGHSGGLPGFGSHWMIVPDYGIGVVSFCNLTYEATPALNVQVLQRLIDIARLKPRQLPASDILKKRQQQLMALLPDWKDAPASGIFSENFFADYLIDSLRKEAKTFFDKAGKVLRVEDIVPENQLRGTFRIVGENTSLQVRFTLSPENPALIQAYSIHETPQPSTSQSTPTPSTRSKYGLKPVSSLSDYRQQVSANPRQAIVPLDKFIPGIRLDIRYATNKNIMHRPVYRTAAAFLRLPAAEALKDIQQELKQQGYGLKIYDGYRPYRVTVEFYEAYHDSNFVASPYTGSRHNRGCAVDLTLVDLRTGKELDMPTPYDDFTEKASATYTHISEQARKNRQRLQDVMLKHGFVIYPSEWWHFDFDGWKSYPVMDLSFEDLISTQR
ncbi:MAG: serine hydrolase [Chitinophagaceae bacterium]|nr:serine hydrolase [Chitinophagaceae bacterium]